MASNCTELDRNWKRCPVHQTIFLRGDCPQCIDKNSDGSGLALRGEHYEDVDGMPLKAPEK